MSMPNGPRPETAEKIKAVQELITSDGVTIAAACRSIGLHKSSYDKHHRSVSQGVSREPRKAIKLESLYKRKSRAKKALAAIEAVHVPIPQASRMAVVFATPDQVLNILRGL